MAEVELGVHKSACITQWHKEKFILLKTKEFHDIDLSPRAFDLRRLLLWDRRDAVASASRPRCALHCRVGGPNVVQFLALQL